MFNLTATTLFEITASGEKLRQLLGLKINRISAAIERETAFHTTALATEKAQEAAEAQLRELRGAHREQLTQLGGVGFAPVHGMAGMRDAETHGRNIRALNSAIAEIRWLNDMIVPNETYRLNRGDLALFGSFSIPGEEYPQLVGAGQMLA